MKAFVLVLVPFLVAYFYLSYKLIVISDLNSIFNQTAAKVQKDFDSYGEDIIKDLRQCYLSVLSIVGASAAATFLWILLLKYNAKIIVWISIFSLPILITVGLYFSISTYIILVREHSLSNGDSESTTEADGVAITKTDLDNDQSQFYDKAVQNILFAELMSYYHNENLWLVLSIFLVIALIVLVIILHSLRRRVRLAIALIRQASKAINGVKSTLFFPFIPRAVGVSVLLHGIVIFLLILAAGQPSYKITNGPHEGSPCNPKKFNKTNLGPSQNELIETSPPLLVSSPNDQIEDRLTKPASTQQKFQQNATKPRCTKFYIIPKEHIWKCHAFNLFATLWLLHFISGILRTTLAGAFASYYWAYKKPDDVPFFAVSASFCRVIKNHIGDIAFGSFLMATIRYIRIIIEFITNRFRKNQPAAENVVGAVTARNAGCFLRVFFWLLDRFLKYIDRNAYIMMSMYGESYLDSAKRAIKLLYKNSTRALVLDYVTYFVLLVSRLLITGLAGYVSAQQAMISDLKYKWLPVVLVVVGSYFISKGLFSVYSMAVDTLFICFLIDSSHNDGSVEKPYFMSKDLRRIMKRTMKN